MNILVNGPQGSGKTTQAKLIAERFNLNFMDSGTVLREVSETSLGKKAKEYSDKGELIPNDLYFEIIREYMTKNYAVSKDFVLTGVPRNVEQIPFVEDVLGIKFDKVVNLVVSEEEFKKRLRKRAEIERRADETDEAIVKRLSLYKEKTEPVLSYYKEKGIVVDVDGEGNIEEIFSEIVKKIGV